MGPCWCALHQRQGRQVGPHATGLSLRCSSPRRAHRVHLWQPVINRSALNRFKSDFETCFAPSAWNAGCWDAKHISNHNLWHCFQGRGAMFWRTPCVHPHIAVLRNAQRQRLVLPAVPPDLEHSDQLSDLSYGALLPCTLPMTGKAGAQATY